MMRSMSDRMSGVERKTGGGRQIIVVETIQRLKKRRVSGFA
jgi:hypothetical protein